jgi:uncharacterized protein
MLLEFRVSNYRSIKDEQCLSLVPIENDSTLRSTNVYESNNDLVSSVLRGCAVYGANASGKSNLFLGMSVMQAIVRDSATLVQAGQSLNVQSHVFDEESRSTPTAFEIDLLIDGLRYQYGFSLTPDRIQEEWLLVYKSAKAQKWFSRKRGEGEGPDVYEFGAYFLGAKDLWKKATRDNALFLSTAVQLNCDQLRTLWDWITGSWLILPAMVPLTIEQTVNAVESGDKKAEVMELLNSADLGISDVDIQRQRGKRSTFALDMATGKVSVSDIAEAEIPIPRLKHRGASREAFLNLQDESQGTQRVFAFAGVILSMLERGASLVVDELENSMHPLLVRHILGLFFSQKTNPRGAQIIFSTHNTSLLDNDLLRRDQIWFTDKGNDLATTLTSLSDFKARKKEAFEKGYLQGRYGAIPVLREFRAAEGLDARE